MRRMSRSRFLIRLTLPIALYIGVFWFVAVSSSDGSDSKLIRAQLGCKHLGVVVEAYQQDPNNVDQRLPENIGDLSNPPWGGPSFHRDGEPEPLDPWGNQYRMEKKLRTDGTAYLFIWTESPDGVKISQFGIGDSAEPRE
jgi:hypothetical protein